MNKTCNLCVHFSLSAKLRHSLCLYKFHEKDKSKVVYGGDHEGHGVVMMEVFNKDHKCPHWERYVLLESWITKVFRVIFKLKGVTK